MPLVFQKTEKDYVLGIWQSTESLDELHSLFGSIREPAASLLLSGSETRIRERLSTHVLLKSLQPKEENNYIRYDTYGKPSLVSNLSISISHTKDYIALLISPRTHVGIDLERIRDRILKIAPRFLNESEKNFLREDRLIEQLHVVWGAKESLYKIHGRGGLDFKNNLSIDPFVFSESGQITGIIRKEETNLRCLMHYEIFKSMMLVYSIAGEAAQDGSIH